jgi:hypothetical protein
MMGPFIRIGLRYLGGYLAARGFLAQTDTGIFDDPDLVAAISYGGAALCALASEGYYWLARKFGWAK